MVDFQDRKRKKDSTPPLSPPAPAPPGPAEDLNVHCPGCGTSFAVPAATADGNAVCPECNQDIPVPKGEAASSGPSVAKLKSPKRKVGTPVKRSAAAEDAPEPAGADSPRSELKPKPKCPKCGVSMDTDAVLCIQCGFDTRTGDVPVEPATPPRRTISPVFPILFVAAVIGAAAAYYHFVMKEPEPPVSGPAAPEAMPVEATAPVPTSAASSPIEAPAQPSVPASETEAPAEPFVPPAPGDHTGTDPGEPAAMNPGPAEASPTAPASGSDPVRAEIAARLDARQPLAAVGDIVALTGTNGRIYRGKILAMNKSDLRLYLNGNEKVVPVAELSARSRTRVDPAYREDVIDQLAEQVRRTQNAP